MCEDCKEVIDELIDVIRNNHEEPSDQIEELESAVHLLRLEIREVKAEAGEEVGEDDLDDDLDEEDEEAPESEKDE